MECFLAEIEGRAFRMAQLATGNRDDALDIVQDAMIKLVQKYNNQEKSSWKPLFYKILESRILDYHRRQKVRNRFRSWLNWKADDGNTEDVLEQQAAANNSEPDFKLEDDQFIHYLNSALIKLPLRQQQVFMLRMLEDLDIRDTANAMQCSESSVKTHYARALKKLRHELKDHYA